MTYTIELTRCSDLMRSLARELREQHRVGEDVIIWPYITREHGITLRYGTLEFPATVTFPSESLYTFLLLKYS
jgi:hypothetical protein